MHNVIEKYINSIRKDKTYYLGIEEFTFTGDGEGDFENRSQHTTGNCIINYIKYCQEQIRLAEEYYAKNIAVR